jgi:hypothetical protein
MSTTYDKITHGYVFQSFNDQGQCVKQEFISTNEVEYEFDGNPINAKDMPFRGEEYHSFDMQQPSGGNSVNE